MANGEIQAEKPISKAAYQKKHAYQWNHIRQSPPTACCDSTPVSMLRQAEGSNTDCLGSASPPGFGSPVGWGEGRPSTGTQMRMFSSPISQ